MKKIPVLAVCGPTASGKTKLSIDLAKRLNGEIICADSMQIYREMTIGTAKPTKEEMQGIPHHLVDFLEPGEVFSVAQYVELAREYVLKIRARGNLPVLCGGTGLYIQSLLDNIQFTEIASDVALRADLYAQAKQFGNEQLWRQLAVVDPTLADTLHPNNLGRVVRALEVYRLTGKTMSELQRQSREQPSDYAPCMLGIYYNDREKLYSRIDTRVDLMLKNGLVEEASRLFEQGFSMTAGQAIGYKELMRYFAGGETLAQAVENIKRESRRYAKRQMTWLRRDNRIHWLAADLLDYDALLQKAYEIAVDSCCKER